MAVLAEKWGIGTPAASGSDVGRTHWFVRVAWFMPERPSHLEYRSRTGTNQRVRPTLPLERIRIRLLLQMRDDAEFNFLRRIRKGFGKALPVGADDPRRLDLSISLQRPQFAAGLYVFVEFQPLVLREIVRQSPG